MRFALLLGGLSFVASATGCCCSHMNRCGSPCAASPCGPQGCQPGYQSFYPQGAYGGPDGSTALAPTPILSSLPGTPAPTYAATAMLPTNPLPTY